MNERIKELIKQAGGEFWQRLENDVVNPEAYITFDPPQSLEKFAELIIKECIKLSQPPGEYPVDDTWIAKSYWEGCYDSSERIKEHFGVEE